MLQIKDNHFFFTSQSVSQGHPDKLCDYISDSVLDAVLAADPNGFVACQTACKGQICMVFGQITHKGELNYESIVRQAVKEVGYDHLEKGFDYKTCTIIVAIDKQSQEINNAVVKSKAPQDIGAGDQGIMFGYATNQTEELMPLTASLCNKLIAAIESARKTKKIGWLRPDCKVQVTVEYKKEGFKIVPIGIHNVVVSVQHQPSVTNQQIREQIKKSIIHVVIPKHLITEKTSYYINPSQRFVLGGPAADAGLTGRKIICDSYGGWGGHGGGAFSGKDPSKVDRSGAYAARWVAKSLVSNKLCQRCVVQISYGIGLAHPLSIFVDSFQTGIYPDAQLARIIQRNFDLRPGMIIEALKLRRPIYKKTASGGHFKQDEDFEWEKPKDLSHQVKA